MQAAIKTREIELREKSQEMTDEEAMKIIQKMAKQRKDSIEQYAQGTVVNLLRMHGCAGNCILLVQ